MERVTAIDLRWKRYTAATTSPIPPPRSGSVIAAETCVTTAIVGGMDEASSSVLDDAWYLDGCNSAGDDCIWSSLPAALPLPSPRADAVYAHTGGEVLVFGGRATALGAA